MRIPKIRSGSWTRQFALSLGVLTAAAVLLVWSTAGKTAPQASACTTCKPLKPADEQRCAQLEERLSRPARFVARGQAQLDKYEPLMQEFMEKLCYRAWKHDTTARDTGPYTATLVDGQLKAQAYNQHAVSRVWYSTLMFEWMERYRPTDESKAPSNQPAPPNGAMMVKEMWTPPLARWAGTCFDCVRPDGTGAVFWTRDDITFSTGWFGSWYGPGWAPDWPAGASNPLTGSGQGSSQFCVNCHAATISGNTFSSMRNYLGHDVHRFLTQFVPDLPAATPHHLLVALPPNRVARLGEALYDYDASFAEAFKGKIAAPDWSSVDRMPSQTYDDVIVGGKQKVILGNKEPVYFQTSTQCLGCHTANATGLQFDMVAPVPPAAQSRLGGALYDISPYALWASSPMGLAGRDPIFFAQLESEQKFHPRQAALVQDTCLQCHGIMGQRQYALDVDDCGQFQRSLANAVPYPSGNPTAVNASYGALARDGISCTTCHHAVLGEDAEKNRKLPANRCVEQKQKMFNPPATHTGFALNFTGNFLLGPETDIYGPFASPLTKLMENSLGVKPIHNTNTLMSSEMCGACHTVHLPVLDDPEGAAGVSGRESDPLKRYPKVYEQTTYPEWAFSAYRTGQSDGKELPLGAGDRAKSCQGCHLPDHDGQGKPYSSKIASIEEFNNYPETDYRLPAADIDLQSRQPYGRHTLVGLNVFFLKMAQQFPDVLGIRINDPSGLKGAVAPLVTSEQAMLDQAKNDTATIKVTPSWDAAKKTLTAQVQIDNKVGHKFPSGVSFRRAFVNLEMLDKDGKTIWASGRTNDVGVIVDETGRPIAGEYWWQQDCSARIPLAEQKWQRHYTVITQQDQAQIYQELATDKQGYLTTSFLSIDDEVKDNRLLPHGFLPEADRLKIARALGDTTPLDSVIDENVGSDNSVGAKGVNGDEDYKRGGGDRLSYVVGNLAAPPVTIRATLYYQSLAPYFLQDRFCVAPDGPDTKRLYFLAGHLNLDGTEVEGWKLPIAQSSVMCSNTGGLFSCP